MSATAKAIIFYGIDFWSQERDDEAPEFLADVVDRDDLDPSAWLLAADGINIDRNMHYKAVELLRAALPVELVPYQHYDVTSYALAVRGTVCEADQFKTKLVPTGVDLDESVEQEAMSWCADRGIDFEPKWRFTAYLGD